MRFMGKKVTHGNLSFGIREKSQVETVKTVNCPYPIISGLPVPDCCTRLWEHVQRNPS